jgi:PAS domain S-box-containing protein
MLVGPVRGVLHETRIFVYILGMAKLTPRSTDPLRHEAMKLFAYLPDVSFFVKNRKSEFVFANPAFVEMLGARRLAEILGKTDFAFSPRELAQHFVQDDRQVMRRGQPMASRVELVPNADRSISWHVTTKVPIRNAQGVVIGLAGFTRDLARATVTAGRYQEMSVVMQHMDEHFREPISVPQLATLAHLSVSQFERRFKSLFQVTPLQYLIRLRLNKACQMLVTSTTKIIEVALQCGFYDHSHFIRQFTAAFGLSPTAYRQQHR